MQNYPELKCPICNNFSSKLEKKLSQHIFIEHSLDFQAAYDFYVLNNKESFCQCGCMQKSAWKGWKIGYSKFVRGHNAKLENEGFSKKETIQKCIKSRLENKVSSWNKGLTKESSEIIKKSSEKTSRTLRFKYSSGEYVSWQNGLTKQSDQRIKKMSDKKSKQIPWNKGLKKDSNISLKNSSIKISESYKRRQAGKRLKHLDLIQRFDKNNFELLNDSKYESRKFSKLSSKCLKCGQEQERTLYSIESGVCFLCSPKESKGQIQIHDFINSVSGFEAAILSDRKTISPKEIDILVPSRMLAIEFNGLFWHSEKFLQKDYHVIKQELCESKGYKILHVFEDEWKFKQNIVKSMISYRLGLCSFKIGARTCEIRAVPIKERQKFFHENHIDGDTSAKFAWGLYSKDQLVACLSVRNPNHKKWKNYFEIARYCQKLNTAVPGGLSRLMSYIESQKDIQAKSGIISYVDTRYGDGSGYVSAGFVKFGQTAYSFWWTDGIRRFNRFKFRADSKRQKTEKQVSKENSVYKIWGCKQLVFIKHFKDKSNI